MNVSPAFTSTLAPSTFFARSAHLHGTTCGTPPTHNNSLLRPSRTIAFRRHPPSRWSACSSSGRSDGTPPQPPSSPETPDDDKLHSELRAKVNELFGGRQNVTIDVDTDADVRFIVNRAGGDDAAAASSASAVHRLRSPWYIFTSIAVVSLVTGAFFTALYYSGAVHNYDASDTSHYEMPTYGTKSYIDPYELLQTDRELQESRLQAPQQQQ